MSANKHQIAITSQAGDPRNPKTWSGTPANIVRELENLGITVFSINSNLPKYQKIIYRLIHQGSGLGTNYSRGRLARNHSGKIVQTRSQDSGCQKVLHTGTLDLRVPEANAEIEHYLFCDTTWNLWAKYTTNIDRYPPRMLQLSEQLERESYAQIEHFFSISEYVRDNLIDHYHIDPAKITVVGTGRGNIKPLQAEKDYAQSGHILFVAKERFEDKGGSLLIEGFKIAQQQNSSLKLVIVGQEEYKRLIGSIPNVTVTGFIPWDELQNLFDTAALFAMPALNEPWGLVYLEALACQNPILGLNRNSLPEITCQGQYGFLVDEPTPEAIAENILQAFSEPNKLKAMGIAGQKYCLEKFSWESAVKKMAQVMLNTEKV